MRFLSPSTNHLLAFSPSSTTFHHHETQVTYLLLPPNPLTRNGIMPRGKGHRGLALHSPFSILCSPASRPCHQGANAMPILLTSPSPHHPQLGRPIPRPDSLPSVDPVSLKSTPIQRLPAPIHSHLSSICAIPVQSASSAVSPPPEPPSTNRTIAFPPLSPTSRHHETPVTYLLLPQGHCVIPCEVVTRAIARWACQA